MTVFETDRLLFRRLESGDLEALYSLYQDPDIRRYFPDGVRSHEETKEELEWFLNGHPDHSELGLWATIQKSSGNFIGRCGLLPWTINDKLEIEIAYMIAKDFWRHGYGSEAAKGLVSYGMETLKLKTLIALIDPDHEASIKTAVSAGLIFDVLTEMEGLPTAIYRISV